MAKRGGNEIAVLKTAEAEAQQVVNAAREGESHGGAGTSYQVCPSAGARAWLRLTLPYASRPLTPQSAS